MSERRMRVPDVVGPTLRARGHARRERYDGAVIGCGPHLLPEAETPGWSA